MAGLRQCLSHLILPAALLGYFSMAYISRMTRSFMLNELAQEYIVAARAKGLSEARVIWRHALRNAMVPLVTVIALSYAGLLEGPKTPKPHEFNSNNHQSRKGSSAGFIAGLRVSESGYCVKQLVSPAPLTSGR